MITEKYTAKEIKKIVKRIGDEPMTKSSQGFKKYGAINIIVAAEKQAKEFLENEARNPAITVMGVVLAANRDYEKQVRPHVERMKEQYPTLTFKKLQTMLSNKDYVQFKEVWGHADEKKYGTLTSLVEKILTFGDSNSVKDDFKIMKKWAKKSTLENWKQDSLGSIRNIGISTFQHLRLVFGIDTVKPDQRIKEVLLKEFKVKLSSEKAILAVEEIARITGHKVIEIDQIFVNYGSGYY